MKHLVYESDIERYLCRRVKEMGGQCIKIGYDGLPDRLILLPKRKMQFVELKREGGSPSQLQLYWASVLGKLGFVVEIPYTRGDIDSILGRLE